MAASVKQNLVAGDAVRAFYHMNDHPDTNRYVRTLLHVPWKFLLSASSVTKFLVAHNIRSASQFK